MIDLSSLDGTTGFQINGEAAWDQSGVSVASAGDVNGDGYGDLIIGARYATTNVGRSGAGYVVFGKVAGFGGTLELSAIDGTNGFKIIGVSANDENGCSVASAGDLNNDGYGDLIIGARNADPNGLQSGSGYVVLGKAPDSAPVWSFPPSTEPTASGSTVNSGATGSAGPSPRRGRQWRWDG